MITIEEKIEHLKGFITRNKFSTQAWNERGLNPSDPALCESLSAGFNSTATLLIEALQIKSNRPKLKSVLLKSIAHCRALALDTEEKEFAVDLYMELSYVVDVDLRYRLSVFLYGHFLNSLIIVGKFLKPDRIHKILSQPCTKCKTELVAYVMKIEYGIPDRSWIIGKCRNCDEYNLFSHGPNIKMLRYKNYIPVEDLSKEDFTFDQAITRLEQIQYFRK